MALLSKGITLEYKSPLDEEFKELTNLQEIPELGNNTPEKIDVTVLSDETKKTTDGLLDPAQDLSFKFLYEKEQFTELAALAETEKTNNGSMWRVTLPDDTTASFVAKSTVKIASVGVSAPLTYTLNLSVNSRIVFS